MKKVISSSARAGTSREKGTSTRTQHRCARRLCEFAPIREIASGTRRRRRCADGRPAPYCHLLRIRGAVVRWYDVGSTCGRTFLRIVLHVCLSCDKHHSNEQSIIRSNRPPAVDRSTHIQWHARRKCCVITSPTRTFIFDSTLRFALPTSFFDGAMNKSRTGCRFCFFLNLVTVMTSRCDAVDISCDRQTARRPDRFRRRGRRRVVAKPPLDPLRRMPLRPHFAIQL